RVCKSHPIMNMFGSFPGAPWSRHNQVYRSEGADAIMESWKAALRYPSLRWPIETSGAFGKPRRGPACR
ncbi:MAG TPA: hypothetical protein VKM93_01225, partial [Terriglobia bacterium]|nr:hypothetical protein [Terriglobia bacterium]